MVAKNKSLIIISQDTKQARVEEAHPTNFLDGMGVALITSSAVRPYINTHAPKLLIAIGSPRDEIRFGIDANIPGDYSSALKLVLGEKGAFPITLGSGNSAHTFLCSNLDERLENLRETVLSKMAAEISPTGPLKIVVSPNTWHKKPFLPSALPTIEEGEIEPNIKTSASKGVFTSITSSIEPNYDNDCVAIDIYNVGQLVVEVKNPGRFSFTAFTSGYEIDELTNKLCLIEPHAGVISTKLAKAFKELDKANQHPENLGFEFKFEVDDEAGLALAEQIGRIASAVTTLEPVMISEHGITLNALQEALRLSIEVEVINEMAR